MQPDFAGYGFSLHAERGKPAQYIGVVDAQSPAEAAGLREGDRIVAVNGVDVADEAHVDVVRRIRSDPDRVELLVVDAVADAYFSELGVVVSASMDESAVQRIICPSTNISTSRSSPPATTSNGASMATFDPLTGTANYSATSNNMKLVHWALMGGLLYMIAIAGLGRAPARPGPSSLYQI